MSQFSDLPATHKPTLLVQCGIHSGEIDGKDAGMMLLRDIAFGTKAHLLDRANLLFIPILNVDGHERRSPWNRPNQRGPVNMGWRTTAQNLNLNRDYMKAQAPEMIALLKLIQITQPALYLDIHVTDGIDYQYDITYGFHGWSGSFAWSPEIAKWLDRTLRPQLDRDLREYGHLPGPLVFAKNPRDLSQGILSKPYDPRFSTGYGDLCHVPSILVENHSLKPFRQRVLGTYVLIESCMKVIGEEAKTLELAIQHDRSQRPSKLGFNWDRNTDHQSSIEFLAIASTPYLSKASGGREVRWEGKPITLDKLPVHHQSQPGVTITRPKCYYIPPQEKDLIGILQTHGIELQTLGQTQQHRVWQYRFVSPEVSPQPFEGRHLLKTKVVAEACTKVFSENTVCVRTDQPLGNLAIALMEPEHVDSLAAWGFVAEILQRTEYIEGYVIAPMAEKMLAEDPELRHEFEAKLKDDPEFSQDAEARLRWFYERSPFYDGEYLRYPVCFER